MTSSSKKDRLKKKFNGVEMSLVDQEIKYTIPKEELEKPSRGSVKKTIEKEEISYLDFLIKIFKIVRISTERIVNISLKYVFKPLSKDLARLLSVVFKMINENKQKIDAAMDKYLAANDKEIIIPSEKIASSSEFSIEEVVLSPFEIEIAQLFDGKKISFSLQGKKVDIETASSSLDFDSTLFEFIVFKLEQTQLVTNVNEVKILTDVSEKMITHTIDFDLKVLGQKWALIFSKNISSVIFTRIMAYEGTIDCLHSYNATTKNENFHVVFSHQRLDVYTKKVQSEQRDLSPKKNSEKRLDVTL